MIKAFSFELNEDMLGELSREFDSDEIISKLVSISREKGLEEVKELAQSLLSDFGTKWMKRTIELGDEYPDRTYEVMKGADERTGEMKFPYICQRLIEIGYLSLMDKYSIPIIENNSKRLIFRIKDCPFYEKIKERCSNDMASQLPCRHLCLAACRTLLTEMKVPGADIEMQAETPQKGYCQFALFKG